MVIDQDGFSRLEGRRTVLVRYAWERQSGGIGSRPHAAPAPAYLLAPMPTVVFTARGAVIGAGHVQMRTGVSTDKLLQEQLVPGISTGLDRIVRLTDKTGATALVHFAWQMPR